MCRACTDVALPLRLVASTRSGFTVLDLDAPTMLCAVGGPDVLFAMRALMPASVTVNDDGLFVGLHDVSTRNASVRAYAHLTRADLLTASRWCETTSDHHQVDRVVLQHLGARPPGMVNQPRSADAQVRWLLHDSIDRDRRRLVAAERTDEERAATTAALAEERTSRAATYRSRNHLAAVERARQRANRGQYLTDTERDLLNIAR